MTNKYENAKIYKLIDNTNGNIYFGSTYLTEKERLEKHKINFKSFINNYKCNWCQSYKILMNNDYVIEKIEDYPCNSKTELRKRENYYIVNFNCINSKKAYVSEEEEKLNWKKLRIEWRKKNKLENNEKYKHELDYAKKYQQELRKDKDKYNKQKEWFSQKINCSKCDKIITRNSLARHKKSEYCLNYIESSA